MAKKKPFDHRPMDFADVMRWNRDKRRRERGEPIPKREAPDHADDEDTTRTPSGGSVGGASTTVTSAETAVPEGDLGSPQMVLNREADTSGTVENLQTGEVAKLDDNPAQTGGRVRVSETDETRAAVKIPDDWKELSWQERRSLASQVSAEPITNGEQANAAIEAELKRRG